MAVSEYRKFLNSLTEEELKEYRQQQREKAKRLYHKNKDETTVKIKCEYCNSIVTFAQMPKHYNSKKCQAIPLERIKLINQRAWGHTSDERQIVSYLNYTNDEGDFVPNF